jgi:response regulator RpfG family c-di-GMP phosphodiesterase
MTDAFDSINTEKPAVPTASLQETVLLVDDEENILMALRRLLRRSGYRCFFATSGAEGLKILEQENVDLIVSDMRMPGMDGAQFLTQVRERWPRTVRMLLTGYADISSTIEALNKGGIYRYISKPWDDQGLLDAIAEGVRIRRLEREKAELLVLTQQQNQQLKAFNEELEKRVRARTEELRQTADMLDLAYKELKDSYSLFVRVFSTVISSRAHLAKSQPQKVADLARTLGMVLKLSEDELRHIYFAGLLMDLGKLSLSDDLLAKAEARLGHNDLPEYQRYPLLGEMTLMAIPELEQTAKLIRSHAEYLDGSGFPDGISGKQIPRGARILRVARDFVGLQSGLMRTAPTDADEACEIIRKGAGKRYDPHVVDVLATHVKSLAQATADVRELRMGVLSLKPGMVVSRDLVNSNGILLVAKGYKLTLGIIEKLTAFEKLEKEQLNIFVVDNGSNVK